MRLAVSLVYDPAVGPAGGFQAYAHRALPFGAVAAVWGYTRIALAVCHILQRLFGVPQLAYVDDFLRASPAFAATAMQDAFLRVHAMLGIPVKGDKSDGPDACLTALGLVVWAAAEGVSVHVPAERAAELLADIHAALRAGRLTRHDAAHLAGRLGHACLGCAGRLGRAWTRPLATHAQHGGPLGAVVAHALRWWQCLLGRPQPRVFRRRARRQCVAWCDGMWSQDDGTGAVGGLLLATGGPAQAVSADIPPGLARQLRRCGKQQRNTQAELLAVLVLLLTCEDLLRNADLLLFEDSEAALHNVLSGAAADADSTHIVAAIWQAAANLDCRLWVARVASASNPADCLSRPGDAAKQQEARALLRLTGAEVRQPVWPGALAGGDTAEAAAKLRPLVDALAAGPADTVTLGWFARHGGGRVAPLTFRHAELCRALNAVAFAAHPEHASTTWRLRRGPQDGGSEPATAEAGCLLLLLRGGAELDGRRMEPRVPLPCGLLARTSADTVVGASFLEANRRTLSQKERRTLGSMGFPCGGARGSGAALPRRKRRRGAQEDVGPCPARGRRDRDMWGRGLVGTEYSGITAPPARSSLPSPGRPVRGTNAHREGSDPSSPAGRPSPADQRPRTAFPT